MAERVVVAIPKTASKPVKVLDSWDDYDTWLEQSEWDEAQVVSYDCRVASYK